MHAPFLSGFPRCDVSTPCLPGQPGLPIPDCWLYVIIHLILHEVMLQEPPLNACRICVGLAFSDPFPVWQYRPFLGIDGFLMLWIHGTSWKRQEVGAIWVDLCSQRDYSIFLFLPSWKHKSLTRMLTNIIQIPACLFIYLMKECRLVGCFNILLNTEN